MAERITGQALYEMHCAANSELVYTWNDLPPYDRMVYVEVAIVLNGTYLAPLQGLVRDWQELLQAHDELDVMSLAEIEGWGEEYEALKQRTQGLLQGAQPYHGTIHKCETAEQQIAQLERKNDALKAVLTSYRVFVRYDAPVLKRGREEWQAERDELIRMATMLLGEEVK